MAPPAAESYHATAVQERLRKHGFAHLRARKYGATVIVESGASTNAFKHFRLRRDTVHLWRLDMAGHAQRWEKTPFRAQLGELVGLVIENFPWTLTDTVTNPERTSDREH